ncbi:hypothetical protein HK098_005079 [Nowakowskiella sp. JEL0407]|nr:hypothetical protein HK098_005079 [Nowakowskiella sp. JEL0407]
MQSFLYSVAVLIAVIAIWYNINDKSPELKFRETSDFVVIHGFHHPEDLAVIPITSNTNLIITSSIVLHYKPGETYPDNGLHVLLQAGETVSKPMIIRAKQSRNVDLNCPAPLDIPLNYHGLEAKRVQDQIIVRVVLHGKTRESIESFRIPIQNWTDVEQVQVEYQGCFMTPSNMALNEVSSIGHILASTNYIPSLTKVSVKLYYGLFGPLVGIKTGNLVLFDLRTLSPKAKIIQNSAATTPNGVQLLPNTTNSEKEKMDLFFVETNLNRICRLTFDPADIDNDSVASENKICVGLGIGMPDNISVGRNGNLIVALHVPSWKLYYCMVFGISEGFCNSSWGFAEVRPGDLSIVRAEYFDGRKIGCVSIVVEDVNGCLWVGSVISDRIAFKCPKST